MSNGAQAVVQCLHALSIRTLFGIPGTQSVSLFEALRQSDQVRVFLAEDERSAAFMANGFGRATGHTAAIATIPGPGVTHALSGIAEARSDSVSLLHLVISGDEPGSPRTRLQSSYREALTPTFYQSAHFARTASEIVSAFEQAWKTLQDGEPGPVLLEISANALDETCPSTLPAAQLSKVESFAPLVTRVLEAKRVSVLAGQGLCDAVPQFREVVNQRGWAVVTNCSARGVLPDAHPALVAPDFGSVGTSTVNQLFAQSDLVLVLGAKLTHNGTFGFQLDFPADRTHRLDRSPDVDDPERIKSWQGSCLAFLERLLEASGPSAGFPRETLLAMR
ncbi:MAG: thiamine pyrophosphate-binding protein, partial [Myxococcota bacterium]